VPVALGGVFWFGVVLLLAVADARGPTASREHVAAYFVVWSTVGLSVAMYMAYASFYVLQTFCLLCGIVYVTVIGIFLLSGSWGAMRLRTLPASIFHDLGQLVRRPVGLVMTAAFLGTMALAAVRFPEPQPLTGLAESLVNVAPSASPENERSEFGCLRRWLLVV
jgi:predicted small integral membrane protein